MSRLEDIEDAVERLSPDEYRSFEQWLLDRQSAHWDQQMDHDSVSGKLDFLFEVVDERLTHHPSPRNA